MLAGKEPAAAGGGITSAGIDYEKSKVPNRDVSAAKRMDVRPKRNATFCSRSREQRESTTFNSSGSSHESGKPGLKSVLNKSEPSLVDQGGGGTGIDKLQGVGEARLQGDGDEGESRLQAPPGTQRLPIYSRKLNSAHITKGALILG